MSWEFNVDRGIRSCTFCAKDTRADMSIGSHSFVYERISATFVFSAEVSGEPICHDCAAALLRHAADELED
jgi:hypothetical protein